MYVKIDITSFDESLKETSRGNKLRKNLKPSYLRDNVFRDNVFLKFILSYHSGGFLS